MRSRVELRRVGIWMLILGVVAQVGGLIAEAIRRSNDPTLGQREGIFDLSSLPHAVFFAGLCLVAIGLVILLCSSQLVTLYEPGHETTVWRRLAQYLAPGAAVALIAGCAAAAGNSGLADGSGAAPAKSSPATALASSNATATTTHTHVGTATGATSTAAHSHGDVIPGTATGNSPCEKASPTPLSPGQIGSGTAGSGGDQTAVIQEEEHGARGMVVQQPLTQGEHVTLEQQMALARTVVAKYPTVKDAVAAGYSQSTVYVPCIGAHYTNTGLAGSFNPATPSELLYDGTAPDSKIVGLSYLVYHPGGAPDGFAGTNDHWHQHNANGGLCLRGGLVVGAESTSQAQCEALGGHKTLLTDIWMLHAWVVPGFECTWGVFSGECPQLGGKLGANAWTA
jgi:hypothetical protein